MTARLTTINLPQMLLYGKRHRIGEKTPTDFSVQVVIRFLQVTTGC